MSGLIWTSQLVCLQNQLELTKGRVSSEQHCAVPLPGLTRRFPTLARSSIHVPYLAPIKVAFSCGKATEGQCFRGLAIVEPLSTVPFCSNSFMRIRKRLLTEVINPSDTGIVYLRKWKDGRNTQ